MDRSDERRHIARRTTDPIMPGELTVGILAERLNSVAVSIDKVEHRMDDGFRVLTETVAQLAFVHNDRYESDLRTSDLRTSNIEKDVAEIREALKWIVRGFIGAIVFTGLTAITVLAINGAFKG